VSEEGRTFQAMYLTPEKDASLVRTPKGRTRLLDMISGTDFFCRFIKVNRVEKLVTDLFLFFLGLS